MTVDDMLNNITGAIRDRAVGLSCAPWIISHTLAHRFQTDAYRIA